jgi:hypothetical protein
VPAAAQTDLLDKKHFYLNLALTECRVSAMLVWHGQSRPEYGNFPGSFTVGTFDIPSVLQEWKFSMRALGFGQP